MTEFEIALQEHLENTLNPHSVVKAQVGLGNVDNTRDMDKPVSTLQEKRIVEIEAKALARDNTKPFTPTEPYHPATKEYVDSHVASDPGNVIPNVVTDIKMMVGNQKLHLYFNDPEDTAWVGTKVVRKEGGYPQNVRDGVVVLDNTVRGQYKEAPFVDEALTNEVTYYYHLFPYTEIGAVNTSAMNRAVGTPKPYKVMGVQIDLNNSNPETSVTYTNDAVGMTPGSEAWDSFFGHRPCLFKDGVVVGYLNPNDFTQFEDGTPADITSGNAGDVMIEFPRRGLVIHTEGSILSIKMTESPNGADFEYLAHTRGTEQRDYFYLGAYKGFKDSANKIRSLSGKMPTGSQTISAFRTQARANGEGYENSGFYQVVFRQSMYILKYKNLNSQAVIGRGYVANDSAKGTGGTEKRGMNWGETTGNQHMKLFGLEDFWGNVYEWVDGVLSDKNRNILTATTGFNDAGTGYMNQGQGASVDVYDRMKKPQGTTDTGFIIKEGGGTDSTYFCDGAYLISSCVACYGGSWGNKFGAGIFEFCLRYSLTTTYPYVASRLMYL